MHDLYHSILRLAGTKLRASGLDQIKLPLFVSHLETIDKLLDHTWEVTGPPAKLRYWRGDLCVEFSASQCQNTGKILFTTSISSGPATVYSRQTTATTQCCSITPSNQKVSKA